MSALSSSTRRPIRSIPVVVVAALIAAGCTVPGSSRLQGPPDDLPPSLAYVTADVLGYSLYDTDPGSKLWAPLEPIVGEGDDNAALQELFAPFTGGADTELAGVAPWVGDAAGLARRELEAGGDMAAATLLFADVRSRPELEAWLLEQGWTQERDAELPAPAADRGGELWSHPAGCSETPTGTRAVCGAPEHPVFEAAAVMDDGIVAARDADALRELLRAADSYAVPARRAMSEFTVEAAERVPIAFVFRADLVRTQVRRPFEGDPALLEFARWATDSNVLVALRDGWIGAAPAVEPGRRDSALRIVGASEWVPDLAPDITLSGADQSLVERLPEGVDTAVAIDDVGQHLRELVRAITHGSGQYATEQDVAEGPDRVELLPVLDELDGPAAIGWDREGGEVTLRLAHGSDASLVERLEEVLDTAGIRGATVDSPDGAIVVTIPVPELGGTGSGPQPTATGAPFAQAGVPPRPPVAWLWTSSLGSCAGEAVGWLTFDGSERMTLGVDVALASDAAGRSSGVRCTTPTDFL